MLNASRFRHDSTQSSRLLLIAILFLAFVLRLTCIIVFTGPIDPEGAEYARIAENLLNGNGYRGIATEGAQLFAPPLFPYLIAALTLFTGDAEIAGRSISLILGTLLVLPVYALTSQLYNRAAAHIAALLVAAHPLLVRFSSMVYCEITYLTLIVTAILGSVYVVRAPTTRNLLVTGALYGMAYLVRPEAVAIMAAVVVLMLLYAGLTDRQSLLRTVLRVSLIPVMFFVCATPSIIWLYSQTGSLRLEAKLPLNYTIGKVRLEGCDLNAQYGIDPDLTERGVWMKPNIVTIRNASIDRVELLRHIAARAPNIAENAIYTVTANFELGSPPLFAFAVLGLFARPWSRSLAMYQLFAISILALSVFATILICFFSIRFYLITVPFFCIWASVGILELSRWATKTAVLMRLTPRRSPVLAKVTCALAVATIVACSAKADVVEFTTVNADARPVKVAGRWLTSHASRPVKVADTSTILAFHAQASYVPFPYCDGPTALRYFDKKGVNYIVVRDSDYDSRPYVNAWIENGIPDARATLIYTDETSTGKRIRIYEWAR